MAEGQGVPPGLGKDLVGLEFLSAEQIRLILDTAEPFKEVSERAIKKVPALRGKTIVNLFFEASTRTRISFWPRGISIRGGATLMARIYHAVWLGIHVGGG